MSTITKHHRCSVRSGGRGGGSVRKTTGTTTMTNKSRYDNVRSRTAYKFFITFFFVVVPRGLRNERGRGGGGRRRGGRGKSDENDEKSGNDGVVATSGFWIVENRRARAEDERNMAEDYDAY